jgi:hypothetical protein
MRITALIAAVLALAGCFVYDNPFDTGIPPTATLQIVVTAAGYDGTYEWNSMDSAYEAIVGSTMYYVYLDADCYWILANGLNQSHTGGCIASSVSQYGALPATTLSGWSGVISAVDDTAGGVCLQPGSPDSPVTVGSTLKVVFVASETGNGATYKWLRSIDYAGLIAVTVGTDSTYTVQSSDVSRWMRVIVTPTDSTGKRKGTPVVSQPVWVL